jgi:hypothetical protein
LKHFYSQVSLGAGAKDELHIVEAEAMNYEGSPIKVTLATLKMSVQPTVSTFLNFGFHVGSGLLRHLGSVSFRFCKDVSFTKIISAAIINRFISL